MSLTDWGQIHGNQFVGSCVLVTGGAGFIGSHLTEALLTLGACVRVLDDLSGCDGSNMELLGERFGDQLSFFVGSVLDEALVKRLADGCQYVFHLAALGSVPDSVARPTHYAETNILGTQIVLEAARQTGVHRFMLAASAAAYGNDETVPKLETMPTQCVSPYAASKVAGESLLTAYAHSFEMDTASLRYFNVFGPRQNANSAYAAVIAAFAKAMIESGQSPLIFGDGEQTRDFVFVENIVHANLLAAKSPTRLNGQVMNIGCGQAITVNQLARLMAEALQRPDLQAEHAEERAGDVKHSLADISRAQETLGYNPIVDFEQGIRETVAWYQQVMAGTPTS